MQGTRTIETESEKEFWEYYESHSPLLLTDCLMNRICWKLERLEKELESKIKAKWGKKDDYTLMSYATAITVTKAQEKFIKEQYNYYIKEKQRIFSKKNKNNNVSEGKLWSVGRKEVLIYDVRKKLNDELKVGYKDLFNMLVKALKNLGKSKYNSINSFLWDVMGDDILEVIPLNQDYLVWDDTGSTEENESVEILGKNVVFEWRKRKIEV
jgi:hypothetical protein